MRSRVAIVDDHEIVRRGLRSILDQSGEFEVVGEASNGEDGLRLIRAQCPDLALVDIRMVGVTGLDLCQSVQEESLGTAVVILTSYAEEELLQACVQAGARGYLLKDVQGPDLVQALLQIQRGGAALHPAAARLVFQMMRSDPAGFTPFSGLTKQEREILQWIAHGFTNREIGQQMHLSENTIKTHVLDILRHLGVKNRIEAAVAAYRYGLI